MKCRHCDKTIPEASSFCPYCGNRIEVVPESWKCPQCNLDVPEGTTLCPNCGNPISAPQPIVYRSYGAEIKSRELPHSVYEEPSFDKNEYQIRYSKNGKQNTNNKYASKAEELIQQGKKLIGEKVKPQFEERIKMINKVSAKGEQEPSSETNSNQPLSAQEDVKYRRWAKGGMWILFATIVLTFVRAGFGFSFWWYIYLIIMGLLAMYLLGATLPESDGKVKMLDSGDASLIKIVSYIGAAMLVVLYLWGPLNSAYTNERSSDSYSFSSEQNYPSWLTKNKFVCETESGGKIIVRLNDNGTAHMTLADGTGAPLRGYYEGTAINMRFNGTFTVRGNNVYLSFSGMSKSIVLEMDSERQRLYGEGGGVFKQSLF